MSIKSFKEYCDELAIMYESPDIIPHVDMFDETMYAAGMATKARKEFAFISKFKNKSMEFEIWRDKKKNIDVFLYDKLMMLYVQYYITGNDINIKAEWQRLDQVGMARKAMFDFYLKNFNAIISDGTQTDLGGQYWIKMMDEAPNLGFKISVLTPQGEIEYDKSKLNEYFSSSDYRFKISN